MPRCINAWSEIMNVELSSEDVFLKLPTFIFERKILNLHWNVLQRAIFSEKRLKLMNKSDGICRVCKNE